MIKLFILKKISQMRLSQLLRDKLGLSQENLAQYLKIPLSQLAMYEIGRRDLSADAHAKLTEMLLFLEQKNGNAEKEIQNSQELKALDKIQIKELEFQEINEQRLLDKIQKKYNQNIQLYLLANHLQTSNQCQSQLFLQLATTGIEKYGIANQTKKLLKIENIKSQLRWIEILKKSK